ncbi:MAG: YihA family ribosome biogenesis GTP-binding protein [Bacteroidales bacterium]|nr:YihA family ribosome biogenesis GTP-binding protein [Bacteroidales bacterium]
MEIQSATFVKSSPDLKSCPPSDFPEFAFAGRSNVGKSSLLNLLINIKNLAKTSATPGKTRLINHYLVNQSWYLVDLPGYGYAKTGKKTRDLFWTTTEDYLLQRETLVCLFVLIDCRHEPLKSDLEYIDWAGTSQIPLALVFTKSDKLSAAALKRNTDRYRNKLLESWEELPPVFITSSAKYQGREEILTFIEEGIVRFKQV